MKLLWKGEAGRVQRGNAGFQGRGANRKRSLHFLVCEMETIIPASSYRDVVGIK